MTDTIPHVWIDRPKHGLIGKELPGPLGAVQAVSECFGCSMLKVRSAILDLYAPTCEWDSSNEPGVTCVPGTCPPVKGVFLGG